MVHWTAPVFDGRDKLISIAAGLALLGGVLAAVTTGVTWATEEVDFSAFGFDGQVDIDYRFWEVHQCSGGQCAEADYTNSELDDADGIGLIRAAGPLIVVGIVLSFLYMAAMVVALFARGTRLPLFASIGGALAWAFLLTGLILMPLGISESVNAESGNGAPGEVTWFVGLYLAITATAAMTAAPVLGFLSQPRDVA